VAAIHDILGFEPVAQSVEEPVAETLDVPKRPSILRAWGDPHTTTGATEWDGRGDNPTLWLTELLLGNYSITVDDHHLRSCATPDVAGSDFDALRRGYPLRHELFGQHLAVPVDPKHQSIAAALGILATEEEPK